MTPEEWRPVPGYEGRYEVSDHGRVRSLGFYSNNRWGTRTWRKGRVLSASPNAKGYPCVALADGAGSLSNARVHRLVLSAFAGEPPPGKPHGLHEDDDKGNNRLENLRWGTGSENQYDAVQNGLHGQSLKRRCRLGHLLLAPNLVESGADRGHRNCLACKLAQAGAVYDAKRGAAGRQHVRYRRGRDGFVRRAGETWQEEAHRRYAHIMRDYDGAL